MTPCGWALQSEFAGTLLMTEMRGDQHENRLDRALLHPGNASKCKREAVEVLRESFTFPVTGFDSYNGIEFINHEFVGWLQKEEVAFTRLRPYRKKPGHGQLDKQSCCQ